MTETEVENNVENSIENSVVTPESPPESQEKIGKNARKKRTRGLPRDPVFSTNTEKKSDKKPEAKPLDVKRILQQARNFAPRLQPAIDTYFSMRSAMMVIPHGDSFTVEPMTTSKYGTVTFYIDDKLEPIEGTIAEAVAFHCIVLSGNSTRFLESFIRKHPNLVSVIALGLISVRIEYTIQQHSKLIEEIERRAREASEKERGQEDPNIDVR